jgi:hypothetical protein
MAPANRLPWHAEAARAEEYHQRGGAYSGGPWSEGVILSISATMATNSFCREIRDIPNTVLS